MTHNKACVTSENMISSKKWFPNRSERVKQEMEMRKLENMTQLKIENSLLCQRNTEFAQEIEDLRLYQIGIEKKLSYFNDLDIEKVRSAQVQYLQIKEENEKITKLYQTADTQRHQLTKDTKRLTMYEEQYKIAVNFAIDFSNDILKQLAEVRQEVTCEEVEDDAQDLKMEITKLLAAEVDATLKGPAPGSKTVTNTFQGHMK